MIKIDMEMPRCCIECPFYSGIQSGTCLASDGDVYGMGYRATYETHYNCPLEEVEEDVLLQ